jgi:hypothetical protein
VAATKVDRVAKNGWMWPHVPATRACEGAVPTHERLSTPHLTTLHTYAHSQVKNSADADGDGVITFDEFVPIVEQLVNRVGTKKKEKEEKNAPPKPSWRAVKDLVVASEGGGESIAAVALAAYVMNHTPNTERHTRACAHARTHANARTY